MFRSNATRPPSITAIKPAAGPLIARYPPLKNVVTTPPIIADNTPDIGDTLEATAIPNARGKATNDTLTAAVRSCLQFSFSPLNPVAGIELLLFIVLLRAKLRGGIYKF